MSGVKTGSTLTRDQMRKLTTKRLLAYKAKLMSVHETPQGHDINCLRSCPGDCGWAKSHPRWKSNYALVKEILANREHVEK